MIEKVPILSVDRLVGAQQFHGDMCWLISSPRKLCATTASGNVPSICLLEGVGFHLDGVIRKQVSD